MQELFSVLRCSLVAGLAGGSSFSIIHFFWVEPLIRLGELYESGAPYGTEIFPADVRHQLLFFLGGLGVGVSFALLLSAAILFSGRNVSILKGGMWGIAAFLVMSLAPILVLGFSMPGVPAGDLFLRQILWCVTVVATGLGMVILVFQRGRIAFLAGGAFLVFPHIFGHFLDFQSPYPSEVPDDIMWRFAVSSLVASAFLWLIEGSILGHCFRQKGSCGHLKELCDAQRK